MGWGGKSQSQLFHVDNGGGNVNDDLAVPPQLSPVTVRLGGSSSRGMPLCRSIATADGTPRSAR
eukprot:COSAG01_NODE_661_length_14426_cov_32.272632_4_plen_64_part_00